MIYARYLSVLFMLFWSVVIIAQPQNLPVMCSDMAVVTDVTATCTGSSSCRACKNCGYCGYCAKRGGSCGVCATTSRAYNPPTPTPKPTSRVRTYGTLPNANRSTETTPDERMANQPYSDYYLRTLVVENTSSLNLRAGPGSTYDIIKRIGEEDRMTFLAMEGNWVKVRLEEGSLIGYVYAQYVAVLQ